MASIGGVDDGEQGAFEVLVAQDVGGGEAQDAEALLFEPAGAARVVRGLERVVVRRAINFDAEAGLGAVEIQNVGAERMLAAEAQAGEAAAAQVGPQDDFRQRHGAPEAAGTVDGAGGCAHAEVRVGSAFRIADCCGPLHHPAVGSPPP